MKINKYVLKAEGIVSLYHHRVENKWESLKICQAMLSMSCDQGATA